MFSRKDIKVELFQVFRGLSLVFKVFWEEYLLLVTEISLTIILMDSL